MAMMPTYDELIQGNKNQRFLSTNPLFTRRRSMGAYGGGYGGDGAGLGTMGAIPDAATANVNGAYQRAGAPPGGVDHAAGYSYAGPSSPYALAHPAEYARDNGGVMPTAPGMAYNPATQQMDAQDPTTGMGDQEIGRMMLESGFDPRVQAARAKAYAPAGAGKPGPINDFTTFYKGMKEQNPLATDTDISTAWHTQKQKEAEDTANTRGQSYGAGRLYPVFDTTGNTIGYKQGSEIEKENAGGQQGKSAPPGPAQKALSQKTLIEDIRGGVANTQTAVNNLKTDFSEPMRAQLYMAVNASDPSSAISNLIGGEFGKSLTPDQQDYLANIQVLAENAMAMRSVLGAGQGSDDLRKAIQATIPGTGTFSKEYASKQLGLFGQTLDRLERGVPTNINLPGQGGGATKTLGGKTYKQVNGQWYEQ